MLWGGDFFCFPGGFGRGVACFLSEAFVDAQMFLQDFISFASRQ